MKKDIFITLEKEEKFTAYQYKYGNEDNFEIISVNKNSQNVILRKNNYPTTKIKRDPVNEVDVEITTIDYTLIIGQSFEIPNLTKEQGLEMIEDLMNHL